MKLQNGKITNEKQEENHEEKTAIRQTNGVNIKKPQNLPSKWDKYNSLSILIGIVSFLTVLFIAGEECMQCFNKLDQEKPEKVYVDPKMGFKKFWAYGKNIDSGYLTEVFTVLDRLGYKNSPNTSDWDLLWSHDYPFRRLYQELKDLKPHQKVNHFPGCGYITNKVDLATSGLKYIPPAFKLPNDKDKLLKYSQENPRAKFLQKDNDHRNIKIEDINNIDLNTEGTFIQEFVDKPLLVNGHKFDIGIYTIITSIDPLRIYIYNGEALLRFCPEKYYPFDAKNLNKYVVGDDYLPTWELPDLDYYFNQLGFGMKESLNAYLRSRGKNPSVIWEQIEDAIRTIILDKEKHIADILQRFKSKHNFFEMMRFDFVIDEDLKIYLLEANMSPNLSSAHFPQNKLLYQQVLYNVLGLVGVGENLYRNSLVMRSPLEEEMIVSYKSIATFPKECHSNLCRNGCSSPQCQLCKNCLSPMTKKDLALAYKEHVHRGNCKRIFPPPMTQEEAKKITNLEEYSPENQLHYKWFIGKCLLDKSWC
ncbi:unnamed protein product [Brassicogethes aeneus]|uniref:Uncharacterized protein n=1 Tax=Brassicogethes aeneus TaxID=1431903 RepID=A0A9P0AVG5_BRAAE|nr:unnamed protein product [Brassicogethes aeneus]